jgi:tRNA (mo5U34)-methyltransferase
MTEHSSELSDDELRARIDQINWFHSIELRPGIVTPGHDDTSARVGILRLPERLDGRTVLDVGAWDGFFSFEAERRGASRVVASDSFAWRTNPWSSKDGFLLAREALNSSVEDVEVDVMDLSAERPGTFDLVLFLGVLYHLRHPLLALERLAQVTAGQLVLETHVDLSWLSRPAMALYPSHELDGDPTNWWGPNPAAVVGMLRAVGFREVRIVTPSSRGYVAARALRRTPAYLRSLRGERSGATRHPAQGRAVFHAYK